MLDRNALQVHHVPVQGALTTVQAEADSYLLLAIVQ